MRVYFLPKQRGGIKELIIIIFLMFHWIHGHVYAHTCTYTHAHKQKQ
jgi:hypothetical protein